MLQRQADAAALSEAAYRWFADVDREVAVIAAQMATNGKIDRARVREAVLRLKRKMTDVHALNTAVRLARGRVPPGSEEAWRLQTLHRRLDTERGTLLRWPWIERRVMEIVSAKRRPLYRKPLSFDDILREQIIGGDALLSVLHSALNRRKQDAVGAEIDAFPDIAMHNSLFQSHMHAAYRVWLAQGRSTKGRFIDVGCGGGMKIVSAQYYFDHCDGLELDPGYCKEARKLVKAARLPNTEIFQTNAVTWDGYDQYDVIYFYRPIRDNALLADMERRIVELARPGALLIGPYTGFEQRWEALDCTHVTGAIYLAKTSKAAARRLLRAAEKTGPSVAHRMPMARSRWDPILQQARDRGWSIAM
ncbi:MAG: class I SAM-dependent methyltransferase [Pseudomonadota bacterium]